MAMSILELNLKEGYLESHYETAIKDAAKCLEEKVRLEGELKKNQKKYDQANFRCTYYSTLIDAAKTVSELREKVKELKNSELQTG